MFLNIIKKLIIFIIYITAIIALAKSSPYCYCTGPGSQQVRIFPTHAGHNDNCSCISGLSELLNKSFSVSEFIIYEGTYIMNEDIKRSLPVKKDGLIQIDIRGEPSAIIKCKENVSFKITRTFGKAIDTMNVHNIKFHNCKEILMESDLKKASVDFKNCTFNASCLKFDFTHNIKVAEIVINNTIINHCNCSEGIIQVTTKRDLRPNIILHALNVTESYSPLLMSKLQILIMLRSHCIFQHNNGFKIEVENNSELLFSEATVIFRNNRLLSTAQSNSTIIAEQATISFKNSNVTFIQNEGSPTGGIMAVNSTQLIIQDNVSINFIENTGSNGGALSFYTESFLIFNATQSNATINFVNNSAQFGGGMYVEDRGYSKVKSVFDLCGDSKLVKVNFRNNSALLGGSQIYGGWIWITDKHEDVTRVLNFDENGDDKSLVASDPVRICLCPYDNTKKEYVMECNKAEPTVTIYGCTLDLTLVAVGQNFTPVLSYVESAILRQGSNKRSNDISPRIQSLQKSCTNVLYKIDHLSANQEETTKLFLEPYLQFSRPTKTFNDSLSQLLFIQLTLQLRKKDCPLGYARKENSCECSCLSSLTSIELTCDTSRNIRRSKQQWVGVVYRNEHPIVVAHQHCPFDYCKANKNQSLIIHLEDPDEQCAFNRSGILCGGCKTNFSRVVGSSKCKKCTNYKLLIIIPCVLLVGLFLVILLILLDLTVSVGTISGLIFYANIIQAQHVTFFGSETTFSLGVFIAWLNFDLGIETCLFNGLDSYIEIWLQFCFPLYISIIAFIVIIASHYSVKISELYSKNIVSVLATLFLLSYTKLLRLVVDVVTHTMIIYPDGYTKAVWLYDGNVDYLKGKHIPLFLATMLLQILLIVYPLSLVSIQWLVKISHYRAMSWVQKLKPFFDAYTGPCKADHCYWTGLLLIVRIILLLIFTLKQNYSPIHNLLAITVVSVGLLTYLAMIKGVYKNSLPNYLELFFLCNLGLTSAAVQFELANDSQGRQSRVPIKISTGVTIFVFAGVIFFHTLRRLLQTTFGAKMKNNIMTLISLKKKVSRDIQLPPCSAPQVTSTLIELKEPLLEY